MQEKLNKRNVLQNACKKKNTLYQNCIGLKTEDAENRYKTYKNKLTKIIRTNKKDYYRNLLEKTKTILKEHGTY